MQLCVCTMAKVHAACQKVSQLGNAGHKKSKVKQLWVGWCVCSCVKAQVYHYHYYYYYVMHSIRLVFIIRTISISIVILSFSFFEMKMIIKMCVCGVHFYTFHFFLCESHCDWLNWSRCDGVRCEMSEEQRQNSSPCLLIYHNFFYLAYLDRQEYGENTYLSSFLQLSFQLWIGLGKNNPSGFYVLSSHRYLFHMKRLVFLKRFFKKAVSIIIRHKCMFQFQSASISVHIYDSAFSLFKSYSPGVLVNFFDWYFRFLKINRSNYIYFNGGKTWCHHIPKQWDYKG